MNAAHLLNYAFKRQGGAAVADRPVQPARRAASRAIPLCVDLDGTLVLTDTLHELLAIALVEARCLWKLPGWLAGGRAAFKQRLSEAVPLDASLLPYNDRLVRYLRRQRANGRRLVLVTGADQRLAHAVNAHLRLFHEVIASDGARNLRGADKARALTARFGHGGFSYVGNDRTDLAVWRAAASGIVVNAGASLARAAQAVTHVEFEIRRQRRVWRALIRALRPYQWVKNILVFVPIFVSGALTDAAGWLVAAQMFAAFCLAASGIYVFNDLTDLAADRRHRHKRLRPFASGELPAAAGLMLAPALLAAGGAVAFLCGGLGVLACYAVLSILYSTALKEQPLVDIFTLAALYTVRLFGGGEITGHAVSPWLLGFSSFLFLSLAAIKRSSELAAARRGINARLARRGYVGRDRRLLEMIGIGATFASSVVLAHYVQSGWAVEHFAQPEWLWLLVPLFLLWQCRLWLATTRGYMLDDPIVYAAKDWVSRYVGLAVVAVFLLALFQPEAMVAELWVG